MGSLIDYIHYAEHTYCSTQASVLARLLCLSDDHVLNENLWKNDIASSVAGKCIAPLDDLIVSHLLAIKALHSNNYNEAFNHQNVFVSTLVKLLQTQSGTNWMLPVMYTACMDLRLSATKAYAVNNGQTEVYDRAAENLMACYRVCAADYATPPENSKRYGLLNPINHLLRIYFKLNKLSMCKAIIKNVERAVIHAPFTLSEKVTFRFFVGRMALVESDFRTAHKHLFFAYRQCDPSCYKNKRIILNYLMPVKMLLGYMPCKHLFERYNLPLFWQLTSAVREGQIKEFEDILRKNESFFTSVGIFVALDNLRLVTYRNVFKKVYHSANNSTIPIETFQAGLQVMAETDVDVTETQSLIASMIYNNKIKAYLSYQHQTVVFNPHNPFPRLSSLRDPSFY